MKSSSYSSLSARDREVVNTVNHYKQVTSDHLERLHFVNGTDRSRSTRTQRALSRLVKWKQLARLDRPIGGHAGGSGRYVYVPVTSKARIPNPHTLDITELMVSLNETGRLLEFIPEPLCHRWVGNTKLEPDGYARLQLSGRVRECFIEVDRSTEWRTKIAEKLRRYSRAYGQWDEEKFPAVVFVVPDPSRRRFIEQTIRHHRGPDLFRVLVWEEAVPILTAE